MVFAADEGTIAATPMLRAARAKRRCLVIADGWFAWQAIEKRGGGKKRQPYWIHARGPIAFAGLIATHADDSVESFAIVTVPASGVALPIAAVMPAIVDERWLESPALVTVGLEGWRVDAVSTWVDDVAHDDAACIVPLGNPAQGELF